MRAGHASRAERALAPCAHAPPRLNTKPPTTKEPRQRAGPGTAAATGAAAKSRHKVPAEKRKAPAQSVNRRRVRSNFKIRSAQKRKKENSAKINETKNQHTSIDRKREKGKKNKRTAQIRQHQCLKNRTPRSGDRARINGHRTDQPADSPRLRAGPPADQQGEEQRARKKDGSEAEQTRQIKPHSANDTAPRAKVLRTRKTAPKGQNRKNCNGPHKTARSAREAPQTIRPARTNQTPAHAAQPLQQPEQQRHQEQPPPQDAKQPQERQCASPRHAQPPKWPRTSTP